MSRFLDHFSRVTSSGRFIPEIDGLRFIAIFSVFLSHTMFYWVIKSKDATESALFLHSMFGELSIDDYFHFLGKLGVCLFFVISGFILALPFAEQSLCGGRQVAIGPFYLRRLTRLEPPYLLCMTLLFLLLRWGPTAAGAKFVTIWQYLASCFYLHGLIYQTPSDINFVTWSLEVEVQFYLLAPLIAWIYLVANSAVRRTVLFVTISGITIAQLAFRLSEIPPLELTLVCYLQYFLAGFLLADFFVFNRKLQKPGSLAWDAVAAMAVVLLYLPFARTPAIQFATPWLIFLFYGCLFKGILFRKILSQRLLTTMGGMCYSIYLLHIAAISLFGRFTLKLPMPRNDWLAYAIQSGLLWIPTLVVSGIFFFLVERPCMSRTWPNDLYRWSRARFERHPG